MNTCARCGHEWGIGRFCTNCGHQLGEPVPEDDVLLQSPDDTVIPDQSEPRHRWWLPIAIGIVLVLLLVWVLLSLLGEDDSTSPSASSANESPASARNRPDRSSPPAEAEDVINVAPTARIQAPPPAPPTTDLDGTQAAYVPAQLVDGTPATCWRVSGDATGTTITFTLGRPTTLTRVGLVNGYAKQVSDGAGVIDWYPNNRRITGVEWIFDDGTSVRQDLAEVSRLQRIRIASVTTQTVQLRILGVTAPGAGLLGRDYTAISEVVISGAPA